MESGHFGRRQSHLLDHGLRGAVPEATYPDQRNVGMPRCVQGFRYRALLSQQGHCIRPIEYRRGMQVPVVRTEPQRQFAQQLLPRRCVGHRRKTAHQLVYLHIHAVVGGHRPHQVLQ